MMGFVLTKLTGTGMTHLRHVKRGVGDQGHDYCCSFSLGWGFFGLGLSFGWTEGGHVSAGNPTIVLVWLPFPLDQPSIFFTLKYLFDAKQGLVGHVHFL